MARVCNGPNWDCDSCTLPRGSECGRTVVCDDCGGEFEPDECFCVHNEDLCADCIDKYRLV